MKYNTKNRTIYVWLPNKLYKLLEQKIEERKKNDIKPVLQLAQAAYLLNLVVYIPFTKKDKYDDGWVPICSEAHRDIRDFSKYMEFLVEQKLLIRNPNNYSSEEGYCYSFRLPKPFYGHKIKLCEVKGNKLFVKGRLVKIKERMESAEKSTQHLTQWLDPAGFEIDRVAAIEMVLRKYPGSKDKNKANQRLFCIESIHSKIWAYSREGKDNRLHSILTNLPKDLKEFIRFNEQPLESMDIKNSQPFILSSLLRNITNKEYNNNIQYILFKHTLIPTMFDGFHGPSGSGDLERFITLVENGEIYEEYGKVLFNQGEVFKNCCGVFSYEEQTKSGSKIKKFDSLRKVSKDIMMMTLFRSYVKTPTKLRIFKEEFPTVYNILKKLKEIKPEGKNFLPILLQNIEADCILDHCTKRIASDHPGMPLFTIHDSIVTTQDHIDLLENEFKRHLQSYFETAPILSREPWAPMIKKDNFLDALTDNRASA